MQIVLGNVLHNHFGIKRIFNESKYRYLDQSRGYYSAKRTDLCRAIKKTHDASRCDIRLISPPAWIELKLNTIPKKKETDKLFTPDQVSFKADEDQYFICVWSNKKLETVNKYIKKILINLPSEIKNKIIQIDDSFVISIFYKLSNQNGSL